MKIRNIILCVIISLTALLSFAGCENTAASDAELHKQLIGGWVPIEDTAAEYDGNGNVTAFSVYEFTATKTKYHLVKGEMIETSELNEYQIVGGNYKAIVEGGAQFAKIKFSNKGNLLWFTDESITEFRPLTQEEIDEYSIPIGKSSSAETEAE